MRTTFLYLLIMGMVGVNVPHTTSAIPSHCLLAMNAQVPEPGNPGHHEPPPGEACKHDARDPAHNCACHRECKPDTDEDGNVINEQQHVVEDPMCRVYCFKDHCHCPIHNCD